MSATDDIKAEIAAINAKVDRLIAGIPERHLRYVNDPDASALKIDELTAQVGEFNDIKSALDALNAKLDGAIADKSRYPRVPGEIDIHASTRARKVDGSLVENQRRLLTDKQRNEQKAALDAGQPDPYPADGGPDLNVAKTDDPVEAVKRVVDNSLDPNNPALTADAAARAAQTGARMG